MDKLGNKIKISKRRIIQLLSAVIYNANFKGFAEGKIYRGKIKGVCVPGLNCYSCPGAIAACPLGSLQSSLNELKFRLPLYIIGTLIIFGILFGEGIKIVACFKRFFYKYYLFFYFRAHHSCMSGGIY